MIFGYDQALQMPVRDLYDTLMMAYAIQTAKDMYQLGQNRLDDFYKKYGDFTTPIIADQNYWNNNVLGAVTNGINEIYDRGGDPLRNASDRAQMYNIIRNLPYGDINKLKTSADNAREYLKERAKLEVAGLYNPDTEQYAGKSMDLFSTLNDGIWDRMSPVPYLNMADFSKSFFDNIQPFERSATRNGITYSKSEISPTDLYNIADAHFNDLVQTPQGRLMYQMYKDRYGSDEAAKRAFNSAVVSGNLDRLRYSDNYEEMNLKNQELSLSRQRLALQREGLRLRQQLAAAKARGDNGGTGTELEGMSFARAVYDTALANAMSAGGITKDWWDTHKNYGNYSSQIDKVFYDFGQKQKKYRPVTDDEVKAHVRKYGTAEEKSIIDKVGLKNNSDIAFPGYNKKLLSDFDNIKKKYSNVIRGTNLSDVTQSVMDNYRRAFSTSVDGKSVAKIVGTPLSDNKGVAKLNPGFIDRIYGADDTISNTAGYTKTHQSKSTARIRSKLHSLMKQGLLDNVTVYTTEEGYGSLRKNSGRFEVMPRIRINATDKDGNVILSEDCYVDIGLASMPTKGGAYLGDYSQSGGFTETGTMTPSAIAPRLGIGEYQGPVSLEQGGTRRFIPGYETSDREYNMFPDYNNWTKFGIWDTDVTSDRLHAGQSVKLGTYGDPWNDVDDDLLDDIISGQ